MKFSIVIPIYKVEKYLYECVDSVLSQSYTDYEIVLVDDGSPDDCPRICDEYAQKDSRIRVIHQENAGQASARNAAIAIAKGEYIMCLDSDDYFAHENALQFVFEKTGTSPDVIIFGYKKLFESDGTCGNEILPNFDSTETIESILKKQLEDDSYGGMAWTKAIKRTLLNSNNIQFRKGMVGEDTDWFLNILLHAESYQCLRESLVIYRQRADSTSHAPKPSALTDFLWILETWSGTIADIDNKDKHDILMSVLAYYFPNLLIIYAQSHREFASQYKVRIKALSNIQDYAISSRALTVRIVYKFFGFTLTTFLLKVLSKLKTRQ